jgi:hypothetical protein
MGLFDRFRSDDPARGRTYEGQAIEPSADEQALARYRYMLKTAPPETIEQAHTEAFARLTPEQRRMVLEQLRTEMPASERAYAAESPPVLARAATRAEMREPGALERLFGRLPAGAAAPGAAPGLGSIVAGSLLGSVAGTVIGSMIGQHFLGSHGLLGDAAPDLQAHDAATDALPAHDTTADAGDASGWSDDSGGDFDVDSFDV